MLEGLFAPAKRLFDVDIARRRRRGPGVGPDVRFFRVADDGGRDVAAFYLDPYSRPANKRGGAWMDGALRRKRRARRQRAPAGRLPRLQPDPAGGRQARRS